MIKSWYLHVREETMAPARMITFIEKHAASCDICESDPDLREEIVKITELILPESKIPKAIRQKNSPDDDIDSDDAIDSDEEIDTDDDTDDTDDDVDEEEDDDSLDDDELDPDDDIDSDEDDI